MIRWQFVARDRSGAARTQCQPSKAHKKDPSHHRASLPLVQILVEADNSGLRYPLPPIARSFQQPKIATAGPLWRAGSVGTCDHRTTSGRDQPTANSVSGIARACTATAAAWHPIR